MSSGPVDGDVPGATTPAPGPSSDNDFFGRIRAYGAVRPDRGRWAAGVAIGLARRWGVDPVLVRGGFVALAFAGVGVLLYGIAWLLLPQEDGRIHAQSAGHGDLTAGFFGAAVLVVTGISSAMGATGDGWTVVPMPLLLIGGLAWWLMRRNRAKPGHTTSDGVPPGASSTTASSTAASSTSYEPAPAPATSWQSEPEAPAPTPTPTWTPAPSHPGAVDKGIPSPTRPYRPLTMITFGVALLAGVLTDRVQGDDLVTAAVVLAVFGTGLVLAGLAGRRGGLVTPAAIITLIVLLASLSPTSISTDGSVAIGDASWAPTTAAAAESGHQLGIGEARLDLTDPAVLSAASPADPVEVSTHVGIGELTIVLPPDTAATIDVSIGLGSIADSINNRTLDGAGQQAVITTGSGDPELVINVSQGIGQITIQEGTP